MITLLKLAGLSAVLSAGVVTAFDAPKATDAGTSAKIYVDRIAPGSAEPIRFADASGAMPRPAVASDASASSDCGAQAWPYVAGNCIASDGAQARRAVRTITIERRDAPNTSTLIRVPVASN